MEEEMREQARMDQERAAFSMLMRQLTALHTNWVEAGGNLTQEQAEAFDETLMRLLDEHLADSNIVDFIMYLISIISHASEYIGRVHHVAQGLAVGVGFLLPEDHPGRAILHTISSDFENHVNQVRDMLRERTEEYVTGTGQTLTGVHPASTCTGGWCVIHNPLPGPWSQWPTHWRGDEPFDIWRGFERICPCGTGHPAVEETLRGNINLHGCCGTCPCNPALCEEVHDADGNLIGYMA